MYIWSQLISVCNSERIIKIRTVVFAKVMLR